MIGVNSIHSSAGRLRTRSMCSVRYGRNYRGAETFCYGWPQRSRTLKPVLYTDLVVSRLQSRRKKKPVRASRPGPRGEGAPLPPLPSGVGRSAPACRGSGDPGAGRAVWAGPCGGRSALTSAGNRPA